jgi:hypothetical protein
MYAKVYNFFFKIMIIPSLSFILLLSLMYFFSHFLSSLRTIVRSFKIIGYWVRFI